MFQTRRPTVLFIAPKARIWVVLAIGILILLGVVLAARPGTQDADPPSQESLPVNVAPQDNGIVFQTELVPPANAKFSGLPELQGGDYFVNYRLQREQNRQESKTMLAVLLDSPVDKTKEEAQAKWLELSKKIEQENEIENLLKIKGFKDVVTNVGVDSVTVVVYAANLTPQQVTMIQDLVVRETKIRLDKVIISYHK